MRKAIAELRLAFPNVPVGAPDGARDENSSYLHLVINYLEYEAMMELVGEPQARVTIERHDFYRGLYRLVLNNSTTIRTVVDRYGLRPTAPGGHVT